jgi:hypothetical protein
MHVKFPRSGQLSDGERAALRAVLGDQREGLPAGGAASPGGGARVAASRNLTPAERQAEDAAKATLARYKADLEAWKTQKLNKFDSDSSFREKRIKKHGGSRVDYVAFLDRNVSEKMVRTMDGRAHARTHNTDARAHGLRMCAWLNAHRVWAGTHARQRSVRVRRRAAWRCTGGCPELLTPHQQQPARLTTPTPSTTTTVT